MSRYDDIASALAAADWSGVSIGNKAIILAAIDALGTASRANTALSALTDLQAQTLSAAINFQKAFWRAQPSCLHLHCTTDCNPSAAHCARAVDVFSEHNARVAAGRAMTSQNRGDE